MPVIHIELKRSGVGVSEAIFQINKYLHEGVFTGLFSLVQIFVAMSPEETVYFASPGNDKEINESFVSIGLILTMSLLMIGSALHRVCFQSLWHISLLVFIPLRMIQMAY